MFVKIFLPRVHALRVHAVEQHKLDNLRYNNAGDQMMQLHCDRMQAELDKRNPIPTF